MNKNTKGFEGQKLKAEENMGNVIGKILKDTSWLEAKKLTQNRKY